MIDEDYVQDYAVELEDIVQQLQRDLTTAESQIKLFKKEAEEREAELSYCRYQLQQLQWGLEKI